MRPREAQLSNRHPRLLFDADGLAALRERADHRILQPVAEHLMARATALLRAAPLPFKDSNDVRRHQGRVLSFCAAWTLTGDAQFRDAAMEELDRVAQRSTWSWVSYADLRTGEVSTTFGLAYDWLYHDFSDQERARLRQASECLGLQAYLDATRREPPPAHLKSGINWNAVTNGGAAILALALEGESPLSAPALAEAIPNLEYFWNALADDGGWNEGLSYWRYGMRYGLLAAEVLRRCGYEAGEAVFTRPGVRNTGYFPIIFQPGKTLEMSFCDSSHRYANPIFHLLGREYGNSDFIWFEDRHELPDLETEGWPIEVFRLLWRPLDEDWLPEKQEKFRPRLHNVTVFPSINWALLASNQPDPQHCLAFKSGSLAASHSHLDLNHISIAIGETLILPDLGRRPYTADYFGADRFQYYELGTHGHNTVIIGGKGQERSAQGELIGPYIGPDYATISGIADGAYEVATQRVRRHVVFVQEKYWILLDDIELPEPETIELRFHTYGDALDISPGKWIFKHNDVRLNLFVDAALEASLEQPTGWIAPLNVLSLKSCAATAHTPITVLYPHGDKDRSNDFAWTEAIEVLHRAGEIQVNVESDIILFRLSPMGWQLSSVETGGKVKQTS